MSSNFRSSAVPASMFTTHIRTDPIEQLFYDLFTRYSNIVMELRAIITPAERDILETVESLECGLLNPYQYAPFFHNLLSITPSKGYFFVDLKVSNPEVRAFLHEVFSVVLGAQQEYFVVTRNEALYRDELFLDVHSRSTSRNFVTQRSIIESICLLYPCVYYPYHDLMPDYIDYDEDFLYAHRVECNRIRRLNQPPILPIIDDGTWGDWGSGPVTRAVAAADSDFGFNNSSPYRRFQ